LDKAFISASDLTVPEKKLPTAMQETSDRQYRLLNQICMTELPARSRLRCGEIAWRRHDD